jgi:hypothetical protein
MALQFLRGNYYTIINKGSNLALKLQESNPAKYENSRVIGVNFDPQDAGQLWMI